MDKRKLMQSNVASILGTPDPKPAPEERTVPAPADVPKFEARGRRRKPRTVEEMTARGRSVGDWDKSKSYTTSFVFDYGQYLEMEEIACEQRVSKKAAVKALLALGIEAYRKKGGF